jgi:glycosyltransferase involved in cell wall biosynthesis
MDKLPISVCIISGAEAKRIGRALESVADWCAEIVVVLNEEVSDGTEEVAAKFGARVFREPWKGHIAQKNSAAAKAAQAWILGLDSDEAVSPELTEEIREAFARGDTSTYVAFSFPRCTLCYGRWIRHGDWYPDRGVRLWKRGQARWGGTDPHDKLEVQGKVKPLRADLLHHSIESLDAVILKALRYSDTFVQESTRQNRQISRFDVFGRPAWRFLRSYLIRRGFLDGRQGYYVAFVTALYTFLRYSKAYEAQQQAKKPL